MDATQVLLLKNSGLNRIATLRHTLSVDQPSSLFELIVNKAPDLIFIADHRGKFSFVNERSAELTGYTKEELLKMNFSDFVDRAYRSVVLRFYARQYFTNEKLTYLEFPIITKAGVRVWIGLRVRLQNVYRIPAFICIARDISEKKAAEESLKASERKYHELFDHSVQAMFQTTPDGHVINANPALLKLMGYSSVEELDSINLTDLYVNPEDRQILGEMLREKGYARNVELQLKRKDGKLITVLEYSRVIRDSDGNVLMYEGILEDITLRKAHESKLQQFVEALSKSEKQLKELNAQKDKLFSVLSHDLRSPFASILGFCDILLEEDKKVNEEERTEFLTYIKEAAQNQLALVNRLLEWTRIESDSIKVNLTELDLAEVAARSVVGLLGLSRPKNIFVHSTLPAKMLTRGDKQLILQVFNNLISNALKFTREGGEVRIDLVQETIDRWIISVRDTGIGIPAEDIPKLFKVEEKYTRQGLNGENGTGLGLPMCKEIMEKLGGSISCESEPSKGTCFYLTFQRTTKPTMTTVLVVDDERGVRALHSRYIKQAMPEIEILHASNGREALELVEKHSTQFIVSDYSMPEMDGSAFLKGLKSNPKWSNIPVLMVTGVDSMAREEVLKNNGAEVVLSKPIRPEQLVDAIRQILSGNRA